MNRPELQFLADLVLIFWSKNVIRYRCLLTKKVKNTFPNNTPIVPATPAKLNAYFRKHTYNFKKIAYDTAVFCKKQIIHKIQQFQGFVYLVLMKFLNSKIYLLKNLKSRP